MESIQQYIKEQKTLLEQTLREMALIKAPTGHEKKRAEYCVEWLQAQGIEEVLSDECTNVIVPWNIQSGKNNCMFMAHLDTVFSEETELMIKEKKGKWCCPGIGDDTANAAILLLLIKYVHEKVKKRSCGVWFVFDVGEEGLGNLAGSRKLMESYGNRLRWVTSFDLYTHHIYTSSVGSYRYRIVVKTKGGHSYLDFGNKSAVAEMAALIHEETSSSHDLSTQRRTPYGSRLSFRCSRGQATRNGERSPQEYSCPKASRLVPRKRNARYEGRNRPGSQSNRQLAYRRKGTPLPPSLSESSAR